MSVDHLELDVIHNRIEDRVLFATLDAPPLNLIGPGIVRDLIRLVQQLEEHEDDVSVVVFDSASPDFFSAHVDMTTSPAMLKELGRLAPTRRCGRCTAGSARSTR